MPDAIITSTASTFGTISGTFAADQSTVTGTVTGIVAGTLSGSVGVPGPAGPAGAGVPAGGTAGQFLQKIDGTNYNTDWVTLNLSAYLTKAANLSDLTNFATARDNLSLGTLNTPTFAGVTAQGAGANVANLTPTSLSLNHATSGSFVIQPSSGITFPDTTIQTTAFNATAMLPYALIDSQVFTGTPSLPAGTIGVTAALGDNDTSLATTAFVQQELLSGTANAKNLEVYVRNQTGSTLAAGAIVYINGATGNRPTVTLAQANNDANSAQTMGFVKTAIAHNGFGYVIVRGECENLDTSAVAEGTQLYLSPTTAGAYTTTKPSAPQHLVYVGIVIRSHPTQGVILVAVQNGYELNELHDVAITSPTNGQVLKYNSTTGLWYNGTDSAGVAWGGITGTLSSQTDLQTALNLKLDSSTAASTYLAKSSNLSDLANVGTARNNLNLGAGQTVDFGGVNVNFGSYVLKVNDSATFSAQLNTPSVGGYVQRATMAVGGLSASYTTYGDDGMGNPVEIFIRSGFLGAGEISLNTSDYVTSINSAATLSALTKTLTIINGDDSTSLTLSPSSGLTLNGQTQSVAINSTTLSPILSGSASTYRTDLGLGTMATETASNYLTTADAASTYFTIASAASKADLASPALTGTPTAPTAAVDTNTTQLATTAYVVGQGYAKLASPTFTGTPTLPTGTIAVTQSAGNNTTAVATTAFVTAAVPALATLSDARQFTNDTKAMSPRDVIWSMLTPDFVDISGPSMTVTNTGTITYVNVGQLSRVIRPGTAGACSSRIRTFGTSQVDQTWTASSRAQPSAFLNFSLRSIHSGRSTTSGVTDANYTCAFYYGKAEADGVGNLVRRGFGWKMVGGAGSRFLQLQAHNGTTLSSVTSSFAVTAGVAFDWDIESDGAGNVTLYVNGTSVATSSGGPTGAVNITGVAWQEEVVAAAALSSPYMDFTNSRGRYIVINTW